ncbi:hypothetical protein [Streptomyces sp. CA-111067]|uniref:hypothetical protein n=1 Tax=Streptomyces sp. CA-111067 TaxID=3240046 RepID=UPI003D96B529
MGGCPRLVSDDDREFIIATATTGPVALGRRFTHWSLRKLIDDLSRNRATPDRLSAWGRPSPEAA